MKKLSRLLCFLVVLIAVIMAFCSISFAADIQYTDNLIPAMTSYTVPSGVVSESVTNTAGPGWRAFDKVVGSGGYGDMSSWLPAVKSAWISYEFTSPQIISKYTLLNAVKLDNFKNFSPKDWTFEAWDGVQWIVLDTRTNITDWAQGIKKEFYFNNINAYNKYRVNISNTNGSNIILDEVEMMGPTTSVQAPTNLTATPGNTKVYLAWDAVEGATNYIIKRSTTPGGPYETITTTSAITYTDINVTNGTTYYYVVTAIVNGIESGNSNEASATPTAPAINPGILEITMTNGQIKEYDMTGNELQDFLTWYETRSGGTGKAYFAFTKKNNIKPFLSRKEYIAYDKISSFEVKEYTE